MVQTATKNCQTTYRCVGAIQDPTQQTCSVSRNQPVGSYVSPTTGVFNENIALTGTDVSLHYRSDHLKDLSIAPGWSFNVSASLEGDYLYLGEGQLLNVKSAISVDNNITTVSIGGKSYVFDADNRHTFTKDSYTQKTLYSFAYDANGKLTSITDAFSNVTTINRDGNGNVISVTAPHGQVNTLDIDSSGDLADVTYADGSKYVFVYANHLMTNETEPNGNEFIHAYDDKNEVTKVTDAVQGVWKFSNDDNGSFYKTVVTKAAGDTVTYKDYYLDGDTLLSEKVFPYGDVFSHSSKLDGTQSVFKSCGVTTTLGFSSTNDPITNERSPASKVTQMPSGLTQTLEFTKDYTYNGTALAKQESTIDDNGAVTKLSRDYDLSTATLTSPEGRVRQITYDPNTLLPTQMQIANIAPVTYAYDSEGRLTDAAQGQREVQYVYDDKGNLQKELNVADNTATTYTYDVKDRVTSITYPDGHTTYFAYDSNGNMLKLTTPTPADFTFTYNGVNKQTGMSSPLGSQTQYLYDMQRRITKIVKPSGNSITYNYVNGLIDSVVRPEGEADYTYACGGKVASVTAGSESINYSYDGDLLTNVTYSGVLNQSIDYTYNNDFYVQGITYAAATQTLGYDKDGLLIQSGDASITRDSSNGLTLSVKDGRYEQKYGYNEYAEINDLTTQIGRHHIFSYSIDKRNSKGQILSKTERLGHKRTRYSYTYDKVGRLIEVKENHKTVERYEYDANGNRILKEGYVLEHPGRHLGFNIEKNREHSTEHCKALQHRRASIKSSYTVEDQLEKVGDTLYAYNQDGYLSSKVSPTGTTSYDYGSLGELKSVVLEDGTTVQYLYNAQNQRVAKEVNGTITEKYLWADLTTLLAVYDGNDNLLRRYDYADSRMPYKMESKGKAYYLAYDQAGTLKAVADARGKVVKAITYDSFGNILEDTNPKLHIEFGFAGGLQDTDTGLVHFGYRDYDPVTGKWTAKDPIGFNGGDTNLYGYVLGDPVNLVDPKGLATLKINGQKIQVHKNDVDPRPSIPHGHDYANNQVIDKDGNIYKNNKQIGKLPKKQLRIWLDFLKNMKTPLINLMPFNNLEEFQKWQQCGECGCQL
ncbi:RHS repeat-associated core domain-containing protein [Sulfurimonas sp. HSL-1716]|uniref:RHS repeat domain-containing protein n=1 Tax=Hydrocurvibacter sulfurireducens TaxID=3131937 RepID=UPI0031F7DC9C